MTHRVRRGKVEPAKEQTIMKPLLYIFTLFLVVLLITGARADADCPYREYGWTAAIGAEGFDQARGVAADDAGNVYVVGSFEEVVDFDPSKRKDKIKAKGREGFPDIYLTTYSPEGLYRWTARIGGRGRNFALAATVTARDDIVITGDFEGKVDFNPSKRKDKHKSHGLSDAFVALLHPDGSYGWTRTIGGPGEEGAFGVTADNDGNIFVAGYFMLTMDFDPGRGVDQHTSHGAEDVFVTKFGPDGSYHWTRTFGGTGYDVGFGVTTDADNNVLVTGEFCGTVDFDPTEGKDIRQANGENDAFVVKLSPDGAYLWAATIGGPGRDGEKSDIAVDTADNVYYTGMFEETVDFDPTNGVDLRVSNGYCDLFISSLGPDRSYRWTRTVGGLGVDVALGIDVSDSGELGSVGNYSLTVDFDPGEGVDERTSNGGRDVFVTRYTTDGDYLMTDTFGGLDWETAYATAFDPESNLLVCGQFKSTDMDFDPTSGVDEHSSNGSNDLFTSKYYCGQCEVLEGHHVQGKRGKIKATIQTTAPGGTVKIEYTGPGDPIIKSFDIDDTGQAKFTLKKLKKGDYHCLITKINDPAGNKLCEGDLAPRTATVK